MEDREQRVLEERASLWCLEGKLVRCKLRIILGKKLEESENLGSGDSKGAACGDIGGGC